MALNAQPWKRNEELPFQEAVGKVGEKCTHSTQIEIEEKT
jgi:hypothetical protein